MRRLASVPSPPHSGDVLDELFGAVPEEFVATRDRIVRDLKTGGDAELAARVKAMKRPTLATWSLNQLALDDAEVVAEYLAASRTLRLLQEKGGDRDALLAAMRGHRDAQQVLVDRAVAHAATRPGNPERVRGAVQDTVEAAALDDAIADALQRGRLTSTDQSVSAFDVLHIQPLPRTAPTARSGKSGKSTGGKTKVTRASAARTPTVDRVRVERARVALEAAERVTAAARADLAAAERAERDAREELRRAEQPH